VSYLVLARKWRPQGFEAITGQEHVTRTLTNAIEQDRVHHAFLFCGARGVGKTSAARVFARALNCRKADGPTAEPCGECEACVEIAAGTSLDVFEIDGASNRGINEIRELRDGVAYAPQRDRFKIYIIDEVHMLTTEAFNALLKTLEEPPRHVKFIFATTEPHKIPVTILSRCQRFDFKRIPRQVMVTRLGQILAAEGVSIDEAGLRVVARESEGSMRDALSLLDRIISFCGNTASYEQVAEVLGVADRSWLGKLVDAALGGQVSHALAVVEGAFEFGLDLRQFATDLVHYLRDVIVLKVAGDKGGLTDLSAEETQLLMQLGSNRSVEDLQRLANIAIKTAERLAHANFPRLELEMAVIRMCSMRPLQPVGELVRRLEAIERHLASGAPLPDPPPFPTRDERAARVDPGSFRAEAPGSRPPASPTNALASHGGSGSQAAVPVPTPGSAPGHGSAPVLASASAPASLPAPAVPPALASAPAALSAVAEPTPAPVQPAPISAAPDAAAAPVGPGVGPSSPAPPSPPSPPSSPGPPSPPSPPSSPEPPSAPEPPSGPPAPPAPEEPSNIIPFRQREPQPTPAPDAAPMAVGGPPSGFDNDAWERVVEGVRGDNPALASALDHAQVRAAYGDVVELVFTGTMSLGRARHGEAELLELLPQYAEGAKSVRFIEDVVHDLPDTPYRRRQARAEAAELKQRKDLETHPLVTEVAGRFDGQLVHVEVFRADTRR